jgi:hypothetical protein
MKESIGLMDPCGVDFTRGISNIEGRSDGRSFLNSRHHIARHPPQHHQIMTLAGVAQSVERVALITAKRSTSRSWVRAPPSAIPISKLIRAAVLLLFGRPLIVCGLPIRPTLFCPVQTRRRCQQIVAVLTKPSKLHAIHPDGEPIRETFFQSPLIRSRFYC